MVRALLKRKQRFLTREERLEVLEVLEIPYQRLYKLEWDFFNIVRGSSELASLSAVQPHTFAFQTQKALRVFAIWSQGLKHRKPLRIFGTEKKGSPKAD